MLCENVQSIMIYLKNKLHLDEEKQSAVYPCFASSNFDRWVKTPDIFLYTNFPSLF